jgi:hypothetical protein
MEFTIFLPTVIIALVYDIFFEKFFLVLTDEKIILNMQACY